MKKIFLLCTVALCACKSIEYQDVNPPIKPNDNLLPALESVVDVSNIESVYTSGSYAGVANNFGTAYAPSNNWGNWMQTTTLNATMYKDVRVNDVINVFNKEVKENITSPYGAKKGYITLKLGYRGAERSWWYALPSILTLGTINLLGFPSDKISQSLEVEVEIWNNKKELVKRYTENVYNYDYVAMYWGYSDLSIRRKVAADNIKQALENIRLKINNDAPQIKKQL